MDDRQAIAALGAALLRVVGMITAMAGFGEEQTFLRRQRNAILRLLRPAESAARRLIVAMASTLVVRVADPGSEARLHRRRARRLRRLSLVLSLIDARRGARRARWVRQISVPRILHDGLAAAPPIVRRPLPMPDDVLDGAGLNARLAALGRALGDMEGRARAFAAWQARQALAAKAMQAAGGEGRVPARLALRALRPPLRIGRPPGSSRRSRHEVHAILGKADALAVRALAPP